jgi:hypothetical protein
VEPAARNNEIGVAEPRGRPGERPHVVNDMLSRLANEPIELGSNVVAYRSPETCPACGSYEVIWGCDDKVINDRNQIHPLVWHETEWMADSFVCASCSAGWIEPEDAVPITWIRPYWRIERA